MSTNASKMGSGSESEAQSEEQMEAEAKRRGPKVRLPEDWFERVRRRVAEGEPVTSAIRAEGMGVSWFYERVGEKPELWQALQKARQVKMEDVLENELCRLVFAGEGKPVYWKGYQVGEERHYSDGLLMFLLKRLLPEKYGNTRASAKRQTEMTRKEQVFKKLLVDTQVALDEERRNRTEILRSVGVPVPPRRKAESGKQKAEICGTSPCTPLPPGEVGQRSAWPGEVGSANEDRRTDPPSPERYGGQGAEGGDQMSEDRSQRSEEGSGAEPFDSEGGKQDKSNPDASGRLRGIMIKNGMGCEGDQEGGEQEAEMGRRGEQRSEGGERGEQEAIKIKSKIMIKDGSGFGEDAETGRRGDTERMATGAPAGNEMAESLWAPGRMMTTTMFEDEAYRRVVEGVPRPIYKQGVQIGERRVKSEPLLKFLLVANVPDKYGKRDLPPLRPEEEPGRKEFTEKHNAMVREDAELNRAFEDWVLCHSANRNHRVPPCTQGRECSIYGCGGKGLLCSKGTEGSEQYKIKIKSMIKSKTGSDIEGGGEGGDQMSDGRGQRTETDGAAVDGAAVGKEGEQRSEDRDQRSGKAPPCTPLAFGGEGAGKTSGKASPCTLSAFGGEGEEPRAEVRCQKSARPGEVGCANEGCRADPPSSEHYGGQGTDDRSQRAETGRAEDSIGEEGARKEREAENVAGPEAQPPPAGNAEGAGRAGYAPKDGALTGGENPESLNEPWRYDPYAVSRKIREAEKARRMRRRQIEM